MSTRMNALSLDLTADQRLPARRAIACDVARVCVRWYVFMPALVHVHLAHRGDMPYAVARILRWCSDRAVALAVAARANMFSSETA